MVFCGKDLSWDYLCCHLDGVTLSQASDIKEGAARYQRDTFSGMNLKSRSFVLSL